MFSLNSIKDLTYDRNDETSDNHMNESCCNDCNHQTNQSDNEFHEQIKSSSDSSSSLHSIISAENSS